MRESSRIEPERVAAFCKGNFKRWDLSFSSCGCEKKVFGIPGSMSIGGVMVGGWLGLTPSP